VVDHFSDPHIALSIARIECHYFRHNCFFRPNQLIEDMPLIEHIPGYIVHGRYDMVCPIDQALLLKQHWEIAELKVIGDAGHAVTEHGISRALVNCCNEMLEIVA
jgi:proline iminopeptidase